MMLDGLVAVLSNELHFEVAGTARSLAEVSAEVKRAKPTVVVADYQLSDGLGTEIPGLLADIDSEACVLLISGLEHSRILDEAVASGCAGFVSKSLDAKSLVAAIETVAAGGSVFPASVIRRRTHPDKSLPGQSLTGRERELLKLLANSQSVDEIAVDLGLSSHTVRNHVRSILSKLHARSQLDAVVIAVRAGLVEIS